MVQQTKRLWLILSLTLAVALVQEVPLAQAEGGLVFKPYWTFTTGSPVTRLQTGDIDGDGLKEVVAVTDKSMVYVLANDGALNWQYEKEGESLNLLVNDLYGDNRAEIYVGGINYDALLSDGETPVITARFPGVSILATFAADIDGDGQREILFGSDHGVEYIFKKEKTSFRRDHIVLGLPTIDIWAGDIDGDGQPEIVPSPVSGRVVYVFKANGQPLWQKALDREVSLVQGGDVDGDGQAEVAVLSQNWELFLLESDGRQLWRQPLIAAAVAAARPVPGQLLLHDLDGDQRAEIVALSPPPAATVHVFKVTGEELWQRAMETTTPAARLKIGDLNHDGQAEVAVATVGQKQVYLIDAKGCCLAVYYVGQTTGAFDFADLNNDGSAEIIVGTETGLEVFGVSAQIGWQELWRTPRLELTTAPYLADLDGDGQGEVVVGGPASNQADSVVYTLAENGELLSRVQLPQLSLAALSAGDVDNDGQRELAVVGDSQIYLLDDNQPRWRTVVAGKILSCVAVGDPDGDGRAEIIAGGKQAGQGIVVLVDSQGNVIWQQALTAPVTAVAGNGRQILAGTETGQLARLTADGSLASTVAVGAEVIDFEAGLAATAAGQVYQLADNGPTLLRQFETKFKQIQLSNDWTVIRQSRKRIALLAGDQLVWQKTLAREPAALALGDLTGDGQVEIAVVTDQGDLQLFGLALNQPPLLTAPDLVETRTGYIYSVNVNNPEEEAVKVGLQIWDPSAGIWLTQRDQILEQGRGRLRWEVTEPFDIWDAGQKSQFRFSTNDGYSQRTNPAIVGPFAIPTTPWYVYYGQRVGLAALILLVPALGWLFFCRQRAYRRSPIGRAEALLKQLQANPNKAPGKLHDLAHANSALLTYLPGLASEQGETAIADLSEGFHLLLIRPEVTGEDIRTTTEALARFDGPANQETTALTRLYELLTQALAANTVSRLVTLQPHLTELGQHLAQLPAEVETITWSPAEIVAALNDLSHVVQTLSNYQRVEAVEDKIAYLGQVLEALGRLEREFRANLPQPEQNILTRIAANWLIVANNTLQDLQGRAQLSMSLKTRHILTLGQAVLSLELTNIGRSPASNITISLVPDQIYAVGSGTAHLDILPAGRCAQVDLPISAAGSVQQFRAEFNITFDDREQRGKAIAFADLVQLLQPATEFRPLSNPYAPGTPLRPGSPIFFGRDDLFQFIAENMAGLSRQNILVLIGQRRMGKTSFLQQLPAHLGEAYLPVYLDGQSLGIDPGMPNFFYDLALTIGDALADGGIELAEPARTAFVERPSGDFERTFLPGVFQAIGQRQLLLLFDEFEELEMRVKSGKLEPTIFPFFRHLMQHSRQLGFIFVGTHRLEALSSDYWSIFFNIALYKHVTFLDQAAARALIVEPVAEAGLLYDDLALDKMLRVTAGHPYFLQLTCHALVNHANRQRRNYLTIQDVNDVLGEMVELGEAHFAFLWEQSSPAEQLILAALNRRLSLEPTVTAVQLVELLVERGVALELQVARETLRGLVERDIVREVAGQPPRYEYKVELVRLWVERYKALGRVVEEVLL